MERNKISLRSPSWRNIVVVSAVICQCLLSTALLGQTTTIATDTLKIQHRTGTMLVIEGDSTIVVIRSKDQRPIVFRIDTIDRLRLTSNGHMGVGVAAPVKQLHVGGSTDSSGVRFEALAYSSTPTSPSGPVGVVVADSLGNLHRAATQSVQSPIGTIVMFAGANPPPGWLLCDGSAVSRFDNAALFSVIGTTYGIGNGTTTFNLPDLRGRFPLGQGTGTALTTRTLGVKSGDESVVLTVDQIPSHSHLIPRDYGGGAYSYTWGLQNIPVGFNAAPATASSYTTGGGQSHNNMPPSLVVNYIIKN
jgi:microcystin-dependent protein